MQDYAVLALVVVSAQVGLVSSWILDDSVEMCLEMQDDIWPAGVPHCGWRGERPLMKAAKNATYANF